jgi:hypothetical protein
MVVFVCLKGESKAEGQFSYLRAFNPAEGVRLHFLCLVWREWSEIWREWGAKTFR